jgi:formylglycine-generating enzyme required for sulfatase activity
MPNQDGPWDLLWDRLWDHRGGLRGAPHIAGLFAALSIYMQTTPSARAGARRLPAGVEPPSTTSGSGNMVLGPLPDAQVVIAGGSFMMGTTHSEMVRAQLQCEREPRAGDCDAIGKLVHLEGHAHRVTLDAFKLDRTEVSVAAYQQCVQRGVCSAAAFVSGDATFDQPNVPITHVSWDQAQVYCKHRGGELPTEAQWEFAARGPRGRTYPWGDVARARSLNHGAQDRVEEDASDGAQWLAAVDAYPSGATPEGARNLAGNVAEWVGDRLALAEDGAGYGPSAARNPNVSTGVAHIARGGSFRHALHRCRSAAREPMLGGAHATVGFRCAYALSSN